MSQSSLAINITVEGAQAERELQKLKKFLEGSGRAAKAANKAVESGAAGARAALAGAGRGASTFERQLRTLERNADLFGLKGLEKIRAQRAAFLEAAAAAGRQAAEVNRVSRAFDLMERRAEAAQRKAQFRAAGAGAAPAALSGRAMSSAGSVAGGLGIFELVSRGTALLTELPARAGRLAELRTALPVLAENAKMTSAGLAALVTQLEALKFGSIESSQAVAMAAATGIPEMISGMTSLARVARDFSVISGNAPSEVLTGLVGGILKEEVEILETQGLLIKFQAGYERFAKTVGKSSQQLTENEKAIARLNQVLEEGAKRAGTYEAALNRSGGALKEASIQGSRALDAVARLADPLILSGATKLAAGLQRIASVFSIINAQAAIFGSGKAGELLKAGGGIAGATRNQMVFGDPRARAALAAPGIDYAGALQGATVDKLFPQQPAEDPKIKAKRDADELRRLQQLSKKVLGDLERSQADKLATFSGAALQARFEAIRRAEALEEQATRSAVRRNQDFAGAVQDLQAERLRMALDRLSQEEAAEIESLGLIRARGIEEKIALEAEKARIQGRFAEARTAKEIELIRHEGMVRRSESPELAGVIDASERNRIRAAESRRSADESSIQRQLRIRAADLRHSEAERLAERAIAAQERIFDNLKQQAGEVFDVMFLRTRGLGDFFRMTMLTALRNVASTATAGVLAPIFGGAVPGGRGGGFGGVVGMAGALGGIGRPGAPGGTPGFAGPVAGIGGSAIRTGGGIGGFGGGAAGLAGLAGLGVALGGAGLVAGRAGGGNPLARAAVGGFGGGAAFGGLLYMNPSLIGLLGVPGVNIAMLAAIGGGAALNALLPKAKGRLKKKVEQAYGVRIEDKAVLAQLLAISKAGGVDLGIRTPAARELIELFALATGQNIGAGIVARQTPTLMVQRGGGLYVEPSFYAGRPMLPETLLPTLPVSGGPTGAAASRLDAAETRAVLMEALGAVTSPARVAESTMTAQKRSIGRLAQYALAAEPTTVLA